jgi:hypothetical protein
MFASQCTYEQFLAERFDPDSENGRAVRASELAECNGKTPQTQEQMRMLLDGHPFVPSRQLDLVF